MPHKPTGEKTNPTQIHDGCIQQPSPCAWFRSLLNGDGWDGNYDYKCLYCRLLFSVKKKKGKQIKEHPMIPAYQPAVQHCSNFQKERKRERERMMKVITTSAVCRDEWFHSHSFVSLTFARSRNADKQTKQCYRLYWRAYTNYSSEPSNVWKPSISCSKQKIA